MKYYIILIAVVVASCSNPRQKILKSIALQDTIKYQKPQTLSITGDFDGDGKQDTITQFLADSTGKHVEKIIDIASYDIYDVLKYFDQNSLYIQLNINNTDTHINTGISCGLYCLINVRDNNHDNKEEIAFVPHLMDESNINTCHIYTLCDNKWQEVKSFGILEFAFDYKGDKKPVFKEIPGYFEKYNGSWNYWDYNLAEEVPDNEYEKLKPLLIGSCQK